jgi:hypothetical protein
LVDINAMKELRIVEKENGMCYIRFYEHSQTSDPDGTLIDGLLAMYHDIDEAVDEAKGVKDEYGCDYITVRLCRNAKSL